MAGDHDAEFTLRLPTELKRRMLEARDIAPKTTASEIVRFTVDPFCAFTELHGRRPASTVELARWVISACGASSSLFPCQEKHPPIPR